MLDIAGVDAAAPIWRETMLAAALGRRMSWYERPADIVDAAVCAPTGLLPGPSCPSTVRELFVAGTVPTAVETYYSRDADGKVLIDPPLEARAWARDAGLLLRTDGRSAADLLRIVSPIAGTVLYLAPELAQQRLVLRAAAAPGIDRITFEIDGKVVGEASAADPWLVWALEPGRHTLRASGRLANGTHAVSVSAFEVKAR